MAEIEKLRTRLKNVQKNVTEYRMTVKEAKSLLKEIDVLLTVDEKPQEIIVIKEPVVTPIRILDGGTF